jgi:hypothetical protein
MGSKTLKTRKLLDKFVFDKNQNRISSQYTKPQEQHTKVVPITAFVNLKCLSISNNRILVASFTSLY